ATDLPVAIGFGIRTPDQAAAAVRVADAAVVASALLATLEDTLDEDGRATADTLPRVLAQLGDLSHAVRAARG
ncbi:tryptophan synthase subunit alpha, partial [Gluconacetobacter azotocaptans]